MIVHTGSTQTDHNVSKLLSRANFIYMFASNYVVFSALLLAVARMNIFTITQKGYERVYSVPT